MNTRDNQFFITQVNSGSGILEKGCEACLNFFGSVVMLGMMADS